MAVVCIGTLLQVRYDTGSGWVDEHLFQNCNAVEREGEDATDGIVREGGKEYSFLNFAYQGATRTRNGDNLQAALVFGSNKISSGYAQKILEGHAVTNNGRTTIEPYQVVVSTCLDGAWFYRSQQNHLQGILDCSIDELRRSSFRSPAHQWS